MKIKFSQQGFEKYSNIKFNENSSSGSRVVQCGQTHMTKLIVDFRNFANAPINENEIMKSELTQLEVSPFISYNKVYLMQTIYCTT
jgi:type III secretion system FlhB-like substrate exporter